MTPRVGLDACAEESEFLGSQSGTPERAAHEGSNSGCRHHRRWTHWSFQRLLHQQPVARKSVAVLEARGCGDGALGRNGAMVLTMTADRFMNFRPLRRWTRRSMISLPPTSDCWRD